ncbi:hypothetical protein [Kribbella catacumbae]|uniref:hypothetical protein n=1 Tax=Kribbella catacumbae TaxID=460086 RepID=UPI0003743FEC|nr:hypothetical protein [Kribbella catacumbae]
MTDRTRPLLIGYYAETFLMSAAEKEKIRQRFLGFAEREGYVLGPIVCQELDQKSKFEHLVDLVKIRAVAAVVVSNRADLSESQGHRLDAEARAQVLVAPPPP